MKKHNIFLRINIFLITLWVIGTVYLFAMLSPDILFLEVGDDISSKGLEAVFALLMLIYLYIIFICIMIFEVVILIRQFKHYKKFDYLQKVNFLAFIIFAFVFVICGVYEVLFFR